MDYIDLKEQLRDAERELEREREIIEEKIETLKASHGDRHLGMGASSPKMRIEKRKSAASVSLFLALDASCDFEYFRGNIL